MDLQTEARDQASSVNALPTAAPRPPGHLFRVVRTLSAPTSSSGVHLCLPRALPPPFEPSNEIDSELPEELVETRVAFQTVSENVRLQQQLPLLSCKKLEDVLYKNMEENCASALLDKHLEMLPQLVVVKTRKETKELRNEASQIEKQQEKGEHVTLQVGSYILRTQFTTSPSTSFVCLRPVFGPTLAQFGEASNEHGQGSIPGWFVAHICVGLVDAVDFLHDEGVVHGKVEASNVMLNLYPTYMHHRYRGYPDVQLIDFSATGPGDEEAMERDNRCILEVTEQIITKWSDVAPFIQLAKETTHSEEVEDALVIQLVFIQTMLGEGYDGYYNITELRERAEDMRHQGPTTIPASLMKLLHADLVTAAELDRAVQDAVVLRVANKKEELGRILNDAPATVDGNGNVGMETLSTVETRVIGDENTELADDKMSGA